VAQDLRIGWSEVQDPTICGSGFEGFGGFEGVERFAYGAI